MTKPVYAWYFSNKDKKLRYGDNRVIRKGITHKVKGYIATCCNGLHASTNILDALFYAPDTYLWFVKLSGSFDKSDDKIAASKREYLWGFDASDILFEASRLFALTCYHNIKKYDTAGIIYKYLNRLQFKFK